MNLKNPISKKNQLYDWASILDKEIEKIDRASRFSRFFLCLKSTLALAITKPNLPVSVNSDFLFFISLNRSDHLNRFDKIYGQCPHKKVKYLIKFTIYLNLTNIFSYITNIFKLNSFHSNPLYSYYAYTCYVRYKSIPKECSNYKIKYFLSCADFLPLDNLLTQYFKKKDVKTITLQEGGFIRKDVLYPSPISEYFLCWGDYIKENVQKNSTVNTIVRNLGLPLPFNKIKNSNSNNIYILLSGDIFIDINKKILNIAVEINKKLKGIIYVQFHPKSKLSLYPNLSQFTLVTKPPDDAQLAIGYYSTILLFLLLSNYQLYLYKSEMTEKIWDDSYLFSNAEELLLKINKKYLTPSSLREHFSSTGCDSEKKYHQFFTELPV